MTVMADHEHHRTGDGSEFHPHHRSLHNGSLTRWVVASFMGGVITALGFLLVADRGRIGGDAESALKQATANDKAIAVMAGDLTTIHSRLKSIETTQGQILVEVRKP